MVFRPRKIVFNHPNLKLRRQKLRIDSTSSEQILWQKIRNNKLGCKFYRQYSTEGYVLDFYCPQKRLGIEIDGGHHQFTDVKVYDSYRTKYIEAYNIKILRFRNSDIQKNLPDILQDIKTQLNIPE